MGTLHKYPTKIKYMYKILIKKFKQSLRNTPRLNSNNDLSGLNWTINSLYNINYNLKEIQSYVIKKLIILSVENFESEDTRCDFYIDKLKYAARFGKPLAVKQLIIKMSEKIVYAYYCIS